MPVQTDNQICLVHKSDKLLIYKTKLDDDLSNYVLSLSDNKPFVFLDSVGEISRLSSWSFLGAEPQSIISYKNGKLTQVGCKLKQKNPFLLLRDFYNHGRSDDWKDLEYSPYVGGPIGFMSYDGARYIEKLPDISADDLNLPDFYFIKPKKVLAHNRKTNELFIYFYDQPPGVDNITELLKRISSKNDNVEKTYSVDKSLSTNMSKREFEKAVTKIQEHIHAGDVYQVNLSQRFSKGFSGESYYLYKRLRTNNPGPFCAYLRGDNFNLLSSSPERLAVLSGNSAETRPIAGTRRRGKNEKEDNILSGHLLLDEKERAEHIMLVDLERNDLGKVCNYSSVHADELMTIEKYSHVIHITSNVCGRLHSKRDAFDLVKALFPGGTITGCPKIRCMEIIEELEPTRRGPYTGSLGYFSYNGNIDINILIRTIVETQGMVYFQAGAGIVADSKPEREYYETISKAQAIFKSLDHSFKEKKWEKMFT